MEMTSVDEFSHVLSTVPVMNAVWELAAQILSRNGNTVNVFC